jgi:5-methylcytosine-specific restriction endonuclease McrA
LEHPLCERCGELMNVVHHKRHITESDLNNLKLTLDFDNLESLCHACHNKEHFGNRNKSNLDDIRGYTFSINGELVITN